MKKLGLMGGFGQESTIAFYRGIVDRVKERLGDECMPDITIESMSIFEVLDLCEHGRYAPVADYLTLRDVTSSQWPVLLRISFFLKWKPILIKK